MSRVAIPRSPLERTAWIQSVLKGKGKSFASVARDIGVGRRAVSQAMFQPSDRVEQAIAALVGVPPAQLFPERYDPSGERLHATRGSKSSDTASRRNVEDQEAA